jgi:predicted CoA-substrate-specific enzyme activase
MIIAGIDVGSLTTKMVILKDGTVIFHAIKGTGVNILQVVRSLFDEALGKLGLTFEGVNRIIATGYGRISIPFSQKQVTEITCNAKGVHHLYPQARMIIDIGGQDTKVIKLGEGGRVENFVMNDKCAAGTGRFLEVAAQTMEVDIQDLGMLSSKASTAVEISSTCTVFAQTEIVSLIARQISRENIIAGLHEAIARRVYGLFSSLSPEGEVIMTGGVARNAGVVKALENAIRRSLLVPENPQIVTALGAALIGCGP